MATKKKELKREEIKIDKSIQARTLFALEAKTLPQTAALALVKALFF